MKKSRAEGEISGRQVLAPRADVYAMCVRGPASTDGRVAWDHRVEGWIFVGCFFRLGNMQSFTERCGISASSECSCFGLMRPLARLRLSPGGFNESGASIHPSSLVVTATNVGTVVGAACRLRSVVVCGRACAAHAQGGPLGALDDASAGLRRIRTSVDVVATRARDSDKMANFVNYCMKDSHDRFRTVAVPIGKRLYKFSCIVPHKFPFGNFLLEMKGKIAVSWVTSMRYIMFKNGDRVAYDCMQVSVS